MEQRIFWKKIVTKERDILLLNNNEKYNQTEYTKRMHNFKNRIQLKEDTEKIRLLKLQKEFEKGKIEKSEINENDMIMLSKLYDEQINFLSESTQKYKNKIILSINKDNKYT